MCCRVLTGPAWGQCKSCAFRVDDGTEPTMIAAGLPWMVSVILLHYSDPDIRSPGTTASLTAPLELMFCAAAHIKVLTLDYGDHRKAVWLAGHPDWPAVQRPTVQITSGAERLPSHSGQRRPGRPDLAQPPKALEARSNSGNGRLARRPSQGPVEQHAKVCAPGTCQDPLFLTEESGSVFLRVGCHQEVANACVAEVCWCILAGA